VVSGTWNIGFGRVFDLTLLKSLPPGSFYTEPPDAPHFAMTGDKPVILQITGYGPSGMKPATADEKTNQTNEKVIDKNE
ncbi:MAG TPA: cupin domain-containing protein, partial [Nitrosospira sp.]|nr:cupin domain-containing protein [Nitrosospira sp.]